MKKEYEHFAHSAETSEEAIKRIEEIIAILRVECPWDRKQNHKTLRRGMIEEAYEVVEAIDNDDVANLREELGDVLLQVVFHSNLAEEAKAFDLTDVINDECEKMIRRHPHVFSEEISNNSNESIDKVLEKWENIKAAEKKDITRTQVLENVPKALPALKLLKWDLIGMTQNTPWTRLEKRQKNLPKQQTKMILRKNLEICCFL